ncbi:CHASE3 domain-containing protein [Phenylobacterium sp. J426]|uniref:sensor histidine kinase n=1 Tax=Phenylobacterium sp. J426 TaxID=2898439 RepID=UPI002151BCB0|nr:sensor histidine kinase [Phenylobacterium sp. J426]MCR5874463.1 CHASE3 domain-containing protein [Phenylobacterium sp. J426]
MPALSQKLVNRLVIAAFLLGFATLVGVGVSAGLVLQRNVAYTDLVSHTYQVQDAISRFRIMTERVETARRGYLLARDPSFFAVYDEAARDLPERLERLRALTADNPRQRENVAELHNLMARQLGSIRESVTVARAGGPAVADFATDDAVIATRRIRALTEQMADAEQRLLTERDEARRDVLNDLFRTLIAAGVLLALVGAGTVWTIVRFTRDLASSRDELRRLNEGLEDEVTARTADLQRANDEIQRFAYIVSHDLRSPLVNVMGFTSELEAAVKPLSGLIEKADAEVPELVSNDARLAVREDLPEAIGFIRTSTQKMDRLINAILRLSREGRRVLTPESIDTQRMLEGIADSLKHRSDAEGATIRIEPGLPNVVSDRLALEQIFSNLVENALKYLKPGRPGEIVVSGYAQHGRAVFEIQDNGRGIDAKDHERIFELFRRSGLRISPAKASVWPTCAPSATASAERCPCNPPLTRAPPSAFQCRSY